MNKTNWHAQNINEVLATVESSSAGLSLAEAEHRLKIHGSNELAALKRTSFIMRFLRQFHNILIYVLLISAATTLLLGYFVDTSVILGVVILNAIFGFMQEGKAEKAIEAISKMLAPNAKVMRGNELQITPAKSLVAGDIVLVQSGDIIPADLRLIATKSLQIQESMLTGESDAVEKTNEIVKLDAPIGDRICMAYSGTTVTYGKGTGVVVATGANTEIGKIGTSLKKIKPLVTPLLHQIDVFGRWLTLAIIIFAAFTFLIGVLLWKNPLDQMFMAAVGLAVAAIPEGLPPILTIILAIGVTRMAKRNAIIRRLPAVETMGAVTTICTDKTGTLTRNEQNIKNIATAQDYYSVEEDGIVINDHSDLSLAINAAILCNDGEISKNSHGKLHIHGNPVDKACLLLGRKAKIDLQQLRQEFPRSDLIPYESEHKFMATLHHTHYEQAFIYIKGAPEQILARCSWEKIGSDKRAINSNYWHEKINALAHKGYRVIAIAYQETNPEKRTLLFEDVTKDLTLIAVFGLIDAPRLEAKQSVEQCYTAGIKVKMITGDHAVTAATIAAEVGIKSDSGVLTGSDIDKMTDDEIAKIVSDVNVYARTSPHHKLRLVQALQTNGELVAMTGDGVNDAPALRKANIGVAMGGRGAEIAKESAAMVIADDNFATIVHAIEEGRIIFDNLKKVILLILPTNAAEALTVLVAVIFGAILPITPVQILWVNMLTAVTLGLALGFEPAEQDVMSRPPRKSKASILSPFLVWRIIFVSILLVTCVFGIFTWQRLIGVELHTARTVAVNMLVLGEAIYLLNCRKLYNPVWGIKTLFGSKPVLIAIATTLFFQLLFTYLPIMQHFFGTAAISLLQWIYILVLSLAVFTLVELEKLFVRRFV
jgi:calcium-translocating P-type ATPase